MFWLWKKKMWNVTKCFYSKEIFQIFFEMLKSSYGKSAGKNFGENIVIYQLSVCMRRIFLGHQHHADTEFNSCLVKLSLEIFSISIF